MKKKGHLKKIGLFISLFILILLFSFLSNCSMKMDSVNEQPIPEETSSDPNSIYTSVDTSVGSYGWEDTNAGSYVSKVKIPTEAVYDPNLNSGVTPYAININGKNDYGILQIGTRIRVEIYVSAYIESMFVVFGSQPTYRNYWGPAPIEFIAWNGEYDYCSSVPGTWSWKAGVSAKSFSVNASYTATPNANYTKGNTVDGEYRYLGDFTSTQLSFPNSAHEFSALLKLHVINKIATNGITYYNSGASAGYEKFKKIRIKLVFHYQFLSLGMIQWGNISLPHTHIMGDGTPASDLIEIPIVPGEIIYP